MKRTQMSRGTSRDSDNSTTASLTSSSNICSLQRPRSCSQSILDNNYTNCRCAPEFNVANMPRELGLDKKQKSLSFSGISVIIDKMISAHHSLIVYRHDVDSLLNSRDIDSLRKLSQEDATVLPYALFTSVRRNSIGILSKVLTCANNEPQMFTDEHGNNLLHVAASRGSRSMCEYLLNIGFSPNTWNETKEKTAMHFAAEAGHISVLELFSTKGNLNFGNDEDKSILFTAISANQIEVVKYLLSQKVSKVGKNNETALHLTAENNFHTIAELLLADEKDGNLFVDMIRSDSQDTALHVAAGQGYFEMTKILLKYGANPNAINYKMETPLHCASKVLAAPVIKLLLENGSKVNARDVDGRPPIHGAINSQLKGATECMKILISCNADINLPDMNGMTALHLAAVNYKTARANLLISQGADLTYRNTSGKTALNFVMKYVPNCIHSIKDRMDAGLKMENPDSDSNFKIKMDFNMLIPTSQCIQSEVSLFMEILNIDQGDLSRTTRILMHPLSEAFLYIKWTQIKWLYYIFILLSHFVYSLTYSTYAVLVYKDLCVPVMTSVTRNSSETTCDFSLPNNQVKGIVALISWVSLLVFTSIYLIKELTKLIYLKINYFLEYECVLNMITILTFFLISFYTNPFTLNNVVVRRWQYHAAGIGVFTTWLLQMSLIGKDPRFGKYVEMFKTVSKTFFNFLIAYVFLFIAFAVSFYILFPGNAAFNEVLPAALVKVLIMMLGELEYDDLYYPEAQYLKLNLTNSSFVTGIIDQETIPQYFPFTAHLLFTIFIVFVSIIIMNLLFGLAVTDIQKLYKTARLHQLIQQIRLIAYMESILFSPLFKYFPKKLSSFLRNTLQGLQNSYSYVKVVEPNNIKDKSLPKYLCKQLVKDLQKKYRESKDCSMEVHCQTLLNVQNQLMEMKNILNAISHKLNIVPNDKNSMDSSSLSKNIYSIPIPIPQKNFKRRTSAHMLVDEDYDSDFDPFPSLDTCIETETFDSIPKTVLKKPVGKTSTGNKKNF